MARHTTAVRRAGIAAGSPSLGAVGRPDATAVSAPSAASRATLLRRRVVAVVALLVLTILLTMTIGRVGAEAELADPVAGHAVVAPGDTLWDVAVESAPTGVDPREQLAAIRALNGLDSSAVAPWSVVLLPAR